jgi:hypothetical protein
MKNDFNSVVGHRFNLRAGWAVSGVRFWQSSRTKSCRTRKSAGTLQSRPACRVAQHRRLEMCVNQHRNLTLCL